MSALPAEAGDGAYDDSPAPASPPAPAPGPGRVRRPGLHVVPAVRRSTAPLAPFVVVVAGFLVLGLAALLGLNTVLAQDAFRIHDLEQSNARLGEREQALQRRLTALESPATLAERAEDLGMVPSSSPLFLRLPDGAVLGAAPEGEGGSADPDALAAVEAADQGSRQAPTAADGGDGETAPDDDEQSDAGRATPDEDEAASSASSDPADAGSDEEGEGAGRTARSEGAPEQADQSDQADQADQSDEEDAP